MGVPRVVERGFRASVRRHCATPYPPSPLYPRERAGERVLGAEVRRPRDGPLSPALSPAYWGEGGHRSPTRRRRSTRRKKRGRHPGCRPLAFVGCPSYCDYFAGVAAAVSFQPLSIFAVGRALRSLSAPASV